MQYLMLIYNNETNAASMGEAERKEVFEAYWAFTKETKDKGVFIAGEALQPTNTATSVRVRDAKTMSTDGPFAETKEQLGGFYLLECKDLDEALSYAAKIPTAKHGTIEVRPIMTMP